MGIFNNSGIRKVFAIAAILIISASFVFATSLKITSSVGDAKIYNSNSKAVKDPSELDEGWILRTFQSSIELSNGSITMEISAGSLLKVTSLGSDPVIYLLDGQAQAQTENCKLVINTTVTSYVMDTESSLKVITTQAEEDCIIAEGTAIRIDGITGRKTTMTAREDLALPEPEAQPEPEIQNQPEAQAEVQAEPVAEAAPEVALSPLEKTLSYGKYSATVTAYIGVAYIDYPDFVTEDEIAAAAAAAYNAYSQYMDGIYFKVLEPGKVMIKYPETYGPAEFDFAMSLLEKELPPYIASLFAAPAAPAAEPEAEAIAEPEPEVEVVEVEQPYAFAKTYSYGDFSATVTAYIGVAYIDYPEYVTDEEIAAAAAAAYSAYSQYMNGIYFKVIQPGKVQLTYPETYGPAEFELAISLLDKELPPYLAALLPEPQPVEDEPVAQTVVAEVVEAPVAEPVAQPVEEPKAEPVAAPAAEPAPAAQPAPVSEQPKAEEPKAEEPAEQPVEEPKADKPRAWGFSAFAIYGQNAQGANYKNLPARTGLYANSLDISIDPYFRAGLWKFALHINFNTSDVMGTLKPSTVEGLTGLVNAITRYIGEISYEGDAFKFSIDRKAQFDVPSAVFATMDRNYDMYQRLSATAKYEFGKQSLFAFADDIQLNAKLAGRSQYAGISYAYAPTDNISVAANVIADVGTGFRTAVLYPTVDAKFAFNAKTVDLELKAGIMARKSLSGEKALGASAVLSLKKGAFSIGAGAAYNRSGHLYKSLSNSPVTVIGNADGNSLDIILEAGINTKHFALNGYVNAPLSIGGTSRLEYQTVKTRSGETTSLTADLMNIQADAKFGKFTLSTGMLFSGFTGRFADLAKAVIRKDGIRNAAKGILDPEVSTLYGKVSFNADKFDIFARGDFAIIGGRTIALSVGGSFTF